MLLNLLLSAHFALPLVEAELTTSRFQQLQPFQEAAMRNVVAGFVQKCVSGSKFNLLTSQGICTDYDDCVRGRFADTCEWRCVECANGAVSAFTWDRQAMRHPLSSVDSTLCIEWLPPTLRSLKIVCGYQQARLDLRALPRRLVLMDIQGNQYYGGLDLSQLPSQFEEMNASKNNFSGTLKMWRLPKTLKRVCLIMNAISRVYVVNGDILSGCVIELWRNHLHDKRAVVVLDGKRVGHGVVL